MKNASLFIVTVILSASAFSQELVLTKGRLCRAFFNGRIQSADWRAFQTVVDQAREKAPTSSVRETEIKAYAKFSMKEMNEESTLGMGIFFAEGTQEYTIRAAGEYGTGISPIYNVSNIKNGKLKMTMVLPVSSHAGLNNTRRWAFADTYDIILRVGGRNGKTSYLAKDVKSRDYLTIQEIEVPLVKGETVEVLYNRHGSFGPDIYAEGRIVGLQWNGN